MSVERLFPNMTGLEPTQLEALKRIFKGTQDVLARYELAVAGGLETSVPPDMVLLTVITAVLTGATRWEVAKADLLANQLAAVCETEEFAQLAVAEAFAGRRKAEAATGVSHGPPEREKKPEQTVEEFVDALIRDGLLPKNHTRESMIEGMKRNEAKKSS